MPGQLGMGLLREVSSREPAAGNGVFGVDWYFIRAFVLYPTSLVVYSVVKGPDGGGLSAEPLGRATRREGDASHRLIAESAGKGGQTLARGYRPKERASRQAALV